MNAIRSTQALNKRELENAVPPEASWHADYRDTAYIYIGGLPFELSEGDLVTMFSQFGEPTHVNLVRDRETGKSKGFAFLKYEDQRSTDLAVDNLGGTTIMGRMLRVDHTRYKKREKKEGEESEEEDNVKTWGKAKNAGKPDEPGRRDRSEDAPRRPLLKEEIELAELMKDHDEEDPMKEYMIQQKKEEVTLALKALEINKKHRHSHRDKDDEESSRRRHRHRDRDRARDEDESSSRRHRHRDDKEEDEDDSSRRQRHHHRSRRRSQDRSARDRDGEREQKLLKQKAFDDVEPGSSRRRSRSRSPRRIAGTEEEETIKHRSSRDESRRSRSRNRDRDRDRERERSRRRDRDRDVEDDRDNETQQKRSAVRDRYRDRDQDRHRRRYRSRSRS